MFTINHAEASQGRYVAPEGNYECIISGAQYATTKGGTDFIAIALEIRRDVQQAGQGETIEWPVWKRKEPAKSDPEGYPSGTIQHISRMVKLENGKKYSSLDDWMEDIIKKPIKVTVKHDEYNGNTRAKVAYVYEAEYPVLDAEDLPF